jgi:hypothetical protein
LPYLGEAEAGRGVIENKRSTDVDSANLDRASVLEDADVELKRKRA